MPSSTSIGPTFGETVANSAIIAIIASLVVISAYIALRFEPKYAVPVLIAVMHDILITAGVYALVGQEVSTATVAALLTILGFSLYDTIIVFDRIRENVPRMPRAAFSQIVNRSMSEVIIRSLATSFCSALPVLALLLFGGETLQAFAFALLVGTISGTYSSVFIAGPVLTAWKEREPVYRRRHASIAAENNGIVPPYATGTASEQVELEQGAPPQARPAPDVARRSRERLARGVRRDGARPARRSGRRGAPRSPIGPRRRQGQAPTPAPKPAAPPRRRLRRRAARGHGHAAAPDGGSAPKPKRTSAAAKRRGKHGRPSLAGLPPQHMHRADGTYARGRPLMGALAWTMMGLALWHFTIFLPDRCWGGIIGAFLGCVFGAILFGLAIHGFDVPGQDATDLAHDARGGPRRGAGLRASSTGSGCARRRRDEDELLAT